MPEIDLTETILSADIAGESFEVIRRSDAINVYGESVIGSVRYPAIGQITPVGANSLLREEAFSTSENSIRVTTTFMLRGPAKDMSLNNYQPDIIIWKGDSFVVRTLDDFSQYGLGMVTAECASIDYIEIATSAPVLPIT